MLKRGVKGELHANCSKRFNAIGIKINKIK